MKLKDIFESTNFTVDDADLRAAQLGFKVQDDHEKHTYTKTIETEQGSIDLRYLISIETESWILEASATEQNNYIELANGEDANGLIKHMAKNLLRSQIRKVFDL
jgi:hypothetical protein